MNVPNIIRPFGGVTGITMQPNGLDLGLDKDSVTSIQKLSTVPGSSTLSIGEVDTAKAIVVVNDPGSLRLDYLPIVSFANGTTLNTVMYSDAAVNAAHNLTVIEFSKIKSLQSGFLTGTSTSGTINITISAVDTSKALAFCSFACNSVDNHFYGYWGSWWGVFFNFASSTLLQLSPGGVYQTKVAWFVVEFL